MQIQPKTGSAPAQIAQVIMAPDPNAAARPARRAAQVFEIFMNFGGAPPGCNRLTEQVCRPRPPAPLRLSAREVARDGVVLA